MRGWSLVMLVAAQTFALRWIGTSSAGWLGRVPAGDRIVAYVAPAVLGGLVALATFSSDGALVLDARADLLLRDQCPTRAVGVRQKSES